MRHDGRDYRDLRAISFEVGATKYAEGSVLVTFGDTKVLCNATIEERVPPFLRGKGQGWVTAEYNMLPRATKERTMRESVKGKQTGRTQEIQRLIGRSLRAIVDLEALGERSIIVDCDVLQADGGTRTASITGAYVALELAVQTLRMREELAVHPIKDSLAAVSVGILPTREVVLDLDYQEDSEAAVDMNIVMTGSGEFVEIQGTGEEATFSGAELNQLLAIGVQGIETLIAKQAVILASLTPHEKLPDKTILIATRNAGKAEEFRSLFEDMGYSIQTLLDYPDIPDVEETGTTFEENARLKAETIARKFQLPVLADDSGLKVDALHGQPGVFSARYAGLDKSDAANNAKLLHELTGVSEEERTAQFHCTLVIAAPGKESLVVSGEVAGRILTIPRGTNGFGYDPLFYLPGQGKTMAEFSQAEKNQISHRAVALEKLAALWPAWERETK